MNKAKTLLRTRLKEERNRLQPVKRTEKSNLILSKLEKWEAFKKANRILFYYTHGSEVDTVPLLEKSMTKKKIGLPVVQEGHHLKAVEVKAPLTLIKGKESVLEPKNSDPFLDPELILVPGLAFDKKGNRLGTGKGYYDRFLIQFPKALKVGLAFDFQMLESLPKDPYDIPVDVIITDNNIYYSNP